MTATVADRVMHKATPEQVALIERVAALAEAEKPDVIQRLKLRESAAAEPGFAGDLRRAIDSSGTHVDTLANSTGIDVFHICDFLEGTAELSSGEIDKIAKELGVTLTFAIPSAPKRSQRRPHPPHPQQGSSGCTPPNPSSSSPVSPD